MSITARMSEAVEALLASLSDHQRAAATAPFDVGDHRRWTYLPGPRLGLSFADMSGEQRALALTMLDAGCSEAGARTARAVIELDMIRRRLSAAPDRQPDPTDHRYWVRILGAPGGGTPWGWRVNGHHLAVHVTVVGREVTVTPNFFGAEPARVHTARTEVRARCPTRRISHERCSAPSTKRPDASPWCPMSRRPTS